MPAHSIRLFIYGCGPPLCAAGVRLLVPAVPPLALAGVAPERFAALGECEQPSRNRQPKGWIQLARVRMFTPEQTQTAACVTLRV